MRRLLLTPAIVVLSLAAAAQAVVPPGTPDLQGKWRMRGVVVRSQNAAPKGTVSHQIWKLHLVCNAGCYLEVTLGKNATPTRLSQVGAGTHYRGKVTGTASCSSDVPGASSTATSLRVTESALRNAHLVARRIVAYVTTRIECPDATRLSVRQYRGVPAR